MEEKIVFSFSILCSKGHFPVSFKDYKAAEKRHIVVTSLDAVPESNPVKHLGPVVLYLIKETTTLRDTGGLSGFVQRFIQEVQCDAWSTFSS